MLTVGLTIISLHLLLLLWTLPAVRGSGTNLTATLLFCEASFLVSALIYFDSTLGPALVCLIVL